MKLAMLAAVATVGGGSILVGACGVRSQLAEPGYGGAGGGSSRGGDGGGGGGDAPDPPCVLAPAGEPIAIADFAEGDADTPGLVALQASPSGPAQIVVQAISQGANFWHPELRLARFAVGPSWPDDLIQQEGWTLAGIDAHAAGRIGYLPGGRVGLGWFRGDEAAGLPTGLKFRPIEPNGWSFGEETFVDPEGEAIYAIAPREGRPDTTWALTYRGISPEFTVETRLALVDARGAQTRAPIVLAAAREYPGVPAETIGFGDGWLAVVGFDTCLPDEPGCEAASVVAFAVQPDPGGAPLRKRVSFPVATEGAVPRRVSVARDRDRAWVAWSEGPPGDELAPRSVVLAALDAGGVAVAPRVLARGVVVQSAVHVAAAPDGPVVTWGERADPNVPPEALGAGTFVVHHERASGAPQSLRFATAAFAYGSGAAAIELGDPRGVIVTWASRKLGQPNSAVWIARLDCQ